MSILPRENDPPSLGSHRLPIAPKSGWVSFPVSARSSLSLSSCGSCDGDGICCEFMNVMAVLFPEDSAMK